MDQKITGAAEIAAGKSIEQQDIPWKLVGICAAVAGIVLAANSINNFLQCAVAADATAPAGNGGLPIVIDEQPLIGNDQRRLSQHFPAKGQGQLQDHGKTDWHAECRSRKGCRRAAARARFSVAIPGHNPPCRKLVPAPWGQIQFQGQNQKFHLFLETYPRHTHYMRLKINYNPVFVKATLNLKLLEETNWIKNMICIYK